MVNFQTMSATGQSPYSQIDRWRPSTSAGVYLSSNTSVNIIAGIILLISSLNHDPGWGLAGLKVRVEVVVMD
ncbi:hypothetical protein Hanom_Chr14g01287661 [Helianthus anomalus]